MITTLTLQEAISQVFGLNDVPEFRTVKPFKEAREWLDRKGIDYNFDRTTVQNGIAVYAFGAGQPQYTIIEDDAEKLKGATIHGILSLRSKSQARRIGALQADVVVDDESGDVSLENPVEVESPVETPKPKRKARKARRSK
jgi:hypothetical protein